MRPFYILTFLFILFTAQGQTYIPAGFVSGTWESAQSPYYIQGNIEIHYDSVLVIEPGVEVLFDGSYKLTVHGLLNASGNEADSILFTAIDTITGWQGIEFIQINENLGISNLKYCKLTHGNKPSGSGGAIYIYQADNVLISNCLIMNNFAQQGGGIYIDDGWIELLNCVITHNRADEFAGGITCLNSVPYFFNLDITFNYSDNAGGVFFGYNPEYSLPFFEEVRIEHNSALGAGGMILESSNNLVLDNCRIAYNHAETVGGIALIYSSLGIWDVPGERNRIYLNKGGLAHDLYFEGSGSTIMNIDTFTVINPDAYLAYPINKFNFIYGIDYGLIQQSDTDLFISNSGSDSNDGLTPESPLRSFDYALKKIISNVNNNNTLWVLPGQYYLNENESENPIILKDNVRIKATVAGESILNADSVSRVCYAYYKNNFTLSGLILKNGYTIQNGGGIHIHYSNGTLDSCEFISNTAEMLGGGVFLWDIYNVEFDHCKFIQNFSRMEGGGLCRYWPSSNSHLTLNSCEFIENHSNTDGGGFYFDGESATIFKCIFNGNTCNHKGAGFYYRSQLPPVTNCLFLNNLAGIFGGGAFIVNGSNSNIVNCTFSDNMAAKGSGIYIVNVDDLNFINNVFWNTVVPYTDMIYLDWGASCNIYYTDLQGGEDAIGIQGTGSHYHWEEGNINSDPGFIDPASGDYSLNWNSSCIEAGKEDTTGLNLPESDLNGNPRIVNSRVDMGAYEFQMPVAIRPLIDETPQIRILPNVANQNITVSFPEDFEYDKLKLELLTIDGKLLKGSSKESGNLSVQLDVSDLAVGIYFIRITEKQNIIYASKIIISR